MAARPATNAPTRAVTKIKMIEEPFKEKSCAILCERTILFFTSISKANPPHKRKMPAKPDSEAQPICCFINKATKNATMAMLHHGMYKPAIKLSEAVNKVAKTKRMNTNYVFEKL